MHDLSGAVRVSDVVLREVVAADDHVNLVERFYERIPNIRHRVAIRANADVARGPVHATALTCAASRRTRGACFSHVIMRGQHRDRARMLAENRRGPSHVRVRTITVDVQEHVVTSVEIQHFIVAVTTR